MSARLVRCRWTPGGSGPGKRNAAPRLAPVSGPTTRQNASAASFRHGSRPDRCRRRDRPRQGWSEARSTATTSSRTAPPALNTRWPRRSFRQGHHAYSLCGDAARTTPLRARPRGPGPEGSCSPPPGRAGTASPGAPARRPRAPGSARRRTAPAVPRRPSPRPAASIHTSRAARIAGRVSEIRVGGGLGEPWTATTGGCLVVQRRHAGEQRGDVARPGPCRAAARRTTAPGRGPPAGRPAQLVGVRLGGLLGRRARVGGRHRVHPLGVERRRGRAAPRGRRSRCAPGRRSAGSARRPTRCRARASRPRRAPGTAASRPSVAMPMRAAGQHQRGRRRGAAWASTRRVISRGRDRPWRARSASRWTTTVGDGSRAAAFRRIRPGCPPERSARPC